jgi:ornithine carbamoyltransferase
MGGKVTVMRTPREAVKDASVVVTDTWVSMGEEAEREKRLKAFNGYMVNEALMEQAAPDAVFMHCLPAHRGQEVSEGVIEGPKSIVFDEAENRLHAQKALLVHLLGNAE